MSADAALWALYNRRAARLAPDVAAQVRAAFEQLQASIDPSTLAQLIRDGQFDQLLSDQFLSHATSALEEQIIEVVRRAAEQTIPELPVAATAPAFGGVAFNTLNPVVVEAIRELNSRVLGRFTDDVRETIRAFVENGIRDGESPLTIARELRQVIGLAPNQLAAVENYRRALEAVLDGDGSAKALGYALRDKRFDASVRNGKLTAAKIDTMVDAYRKRMIAFHAETVSRTATLDAYRLGQQLTWQRAIDSGAVDASRLTKTWVAVMDSRTRPEHRELNRTTVLFSEPFPNGEMIPGESTYNCRCVSRMRVLAPGETLPLLPDPRPAAPDAALETTAPDAALSPQAG